MQSARPLVSVVIATYNRADILPFAIRSVLLNENIDLEVIVVGDGCTDDTAVAVAAIGDARVRFVNLPQNWGEQSVPSNEGIAQARGEFVAFLNHDDLFLPWHLSDLLATHRELSADVVWSPYIVAFAAPPGTSGLHRPRYELAGVTAANSLEPVVFIVASATCYRKNVLEKIGGWTPASRTILSPSQDLLFKAYQAGFSIRRTDLPSVIALYGGERKDSYARPSAEEHRWFFELVQHGGERLVSELLRAGVHDAAKRQRVLGQTSAAFFALWRLHRYVCAVFLRLGIHPNALRMWIQHRRRGGLINSIRKLSGLPAVDFSLREKERGKQS
jgi:glycosyltransferase involved in cell wall biosynthesis